VVAVAGFLIFDRIRKGAMAYPFRIYATAVIVIVVLTIYAVAGRYIGGGAVTPLSPIGPGSNETSTGSNSTPPLNATGSGGVGPVALSLPPWLLFALVATLALIGTAVAMRVLAKRIPSKGLSPVASVEQVRELLAQASASLETDEEPRAVLIRLYGTLLERLTPIVGDTDRQTAEEIRVGHLMRLGIRPDTAQEITHLFEEARYSPHPIGPGEVARAKSAIHRAVYELDAKEAHRA
jgi:hypothetical protein